MTYNQAQELGGKVRAGEKGTAIVFAGAVTPKDESGQPVEREGEGERRIPFLKRYYVFNAEQVDGLPEGRFPVPERIFTNRDTRDPVLDERSEEHTSELQSLMRISYAVFCLTKKN